MRLITLLPLAVLASSAHAYVYLQCADLLIATNLLTGLVNAVLNLLSPTNSYAGCPSFCATQNKKYSLYQPGLAGLLGTCYCTDSSPTATYATSGVDASGTCGIAVYQINYIPSAQWSMSGCATGTTLLGGPAATSTTDAGVCFSQCSSYAFMSLTPSPAGTFSCQCGMAKTGGTSATCNDNVANMYVNAAVTASNGARRRRRLEAQARRAAIPQFCPSNLSACIIPRSSVSYECVDTTSELESCGGCVTGYIDQAPSANVTLGTDCSTLPGVAIGGVSCIQSKCKVTRCRNGFELVNGNCHRKLNLLNARSN